MLKSTIKGSWPISHDPLFMFSVPIVGQSAKRGNDFLLSVYGKYFLCKKSKIKENTKNTNIC